MQPSYNEIDRDHRARLLRRACRYVDDDAAEDVVQVALLKAWQALPAAKFGNEGQGVMAWLNAILANTAKDYLRHMKTRPEVPFSYLVGFDEESGGGLGIAEAMTNASGQSRGDKPIRAADDGPDRRDIERAWKKLTPTQREALAMSAAGHTCDQIGAALEVPITTARDRVRSGREILAEALA